MKLRELIESDISNYHTMNEDDMIKYVAKWGNNIVHILNAGIRPSIKVLTVAVKDARDPNTFKDIFKIYGDTLDPRVRLAAVSAFGPNIIHIPNPTETEQIAAINNNIFSINNIPFNLLTKKSLLTILTNKIFIKYRNGINYHKFVTEYFKDNTILMNKWLRYAENMRDQL